MGKLDGRVAIVTGGGRRIGKGVSIALAEEGASVVIAEIERETAEATAAQICERGGNAIGVVCDVSNESQVKRMVEKAVEQFGGIDILVNNAHKWLGPAPLEEGDDAWWDTCFDNGPKAMWYCCKAVFPHMKKRGGGRIINMGSSVEVDGSKGLGAYASAKAAIRSLSRVAAREWGPFRINVNVIWPMMLLEETSSSPWMEKYPTEGQRIMLSKMIPWEHLEPLQKNPEKAIGRSVVYLAGEDSDLVTGQVLEVDGGM
jgi:NAD(P)-dependent dehydrogenase (short-subunit alcohol dehydrogenase family)